jgi:hypothetical protein
VQEVLGFERKEITTGDPVAHEAADPGLAHRQTYGRARPECRRRKPLPGVGKHGVDRRISGKGAETGEETERSLETRAGGRRTLDQTKRWEQEQEASEAAAAAMEERVDKAVKGFQKHPGVVSKKMEEAIKKMGVKARPQTGGKVGGTGSGLPTGEPGGE